MSFTDVVGLAAIVSMICDLVIVGLTIRAYRTGAMESPSSPLLEQRLKRRSVIIASLLLLTLGSIGYDFYDRHYSGPDPIQRVKDDAGTVIAWGPAGHRDGQPHRLHIVADGGRILSYDPSFQSDYRLALICFHDDGTKDFRDIDDLQKSALYDIRNGTVPIILTVDDAYVEEWKRGARMTHYFLFLIPKGIEMSQFSTIRQAEALDAIQVAGRYGPP